MSNTRNEAKRLLQHITGAEIDLSKFDRDQLEAEWRVMVSNLEAANANVERLRAALVEIDNAPEPDHHVPEFRHIKDVAAVVLTSAESEKP